jgi:hemolysin D
MVIDTAKPRLRWHDPLNLIQDEAPQQVTRIVLWSICALVLITLIWSTIGKVDIVASADGKLVPQTLVKVVQPAESGVIKELFVTEGQYVRAGQLLARLDTTLAKAERSGIVSDIAMQKLQKRRLDAELTGTPMTREIGDDAQMYQTVHSQYLAHVRAYQDSIEQEQSMLAKQINERLSAEQVLRKIEQTLPTYDKIATAYAKLEKEGFAGSLMANDKQREAIEKTRDLDAQRATLTALGAGIIAQQKRISQLNSAYRSDLERERSDTLGKLTQLTPNLDKTDYRTGLMDLKAPQDGIIKDLSTTTIGAVVQPGAVLITLIPKDEPLYADVSVRNEDVGFTHVGQKVKLKLATYPFQQYGMLDGEVERLSIDASDNGRNIQNAQQSINSGETDDRTNSGSMMYRARIRLLRQNLNGPDGNLLPLVPGMQTIAEIHQGRRTVLEYLLSPLQKTITDSAHER